MGLTRAERDLAAQRLREIGRELDQLGTWLGRHGEDRAAGQLASAGRLVTVAGWHVEDGPDSPDPGRVNGWHGTGRLPPPSR